MKCRFLRWLLFCLCMPPRLFACSSASVLCACEYMRQRGAPPIRTPQPIRAIIAIIIVIAITIVRISTVAVNMVSSSQQSQP